MFCEKCGAQLPDNAKFCERCGSSTVPGAAPGPAVAVAAAPSAASVALKKFFSKKSNVIICIVALLLIIATIVIVSVIASQPEKYYLDDCFEVTFSGIDGYGSAHIEWDHEKLEKFEKEIFISEDYVGSLRYAIDLDLDYEEGLSNDDNVSIKLSIPEDLDQYIAGNLLLKKSSVKVSGLEAPTVFDLSDYVTDVKFKGYNGYGTLVTEKLFEGSISETLVITVYANYEKVSVHFTRDTDNSYFSENIYFYTDSYENLKNGDTIKFTYNLSDNNREYFARNGIAFNSTEASVKVGGLQEPVAFDVASKISPKFEGFNTIGYMTIDFGKLSYEVGDCHIEISNESSTYRRRIYLDISNTKTGDSYSISYTADKYESLANGNVITFSTGTNPDHIERYCGITLPTSFQYTVSGLEDSVDSAIFDNAEITFNGYNEYATLGFNIPDDKLEYTVGDYTFKLAVTRTTSKLTIAVVVKNAEGESFISLNYYTYNIAGLRNGNNITFNCSDYSNTLKNYLVTYGISFPSSVTYEISGLEEPTVIDPSNYVEYSFSESDGRIILNAVLKENKITVNDCTINFSLENIASWGTEYCHLNIEVTNADGEAVSTGYYRVKRSGLNHGDVISMSSNITNKSDLATLCGIIFDQSTKSIIVSA